VPGHTTLRIAWRNLGRNRKRTLLAVGAIALGQTTLIFVNSLMAGSFQDMLRIITGPMVGHVQIHHRDWPEERAIDLYVTDLEAARTALEAVPEIRTVAPRIYSPVLVASGEKTDEPAMAEPGVIVGVDVTVEAAEGGLLEALDAAQLPEAGEVVIGRVLANRLGVAPGQQLAIIGQDADGFPVSELLRVAATTNANVDLVKTMGVIMSLDIAGELLAMPDEAHQIVVQGDDHRGAAQLARTVAAALPSAAGIQVQTWEESVPELAAIISMKGWFDLVFLAIVFAAAAAGIANTAMVSTFERTHEFGMLLAVGTRPGRVAGMVLIEAVIIGLLGVLAGSLVGSALVLITGQTGINYAALAGNQVEEVAFGGVTFSYIIHPRFELRHIWFGFTAGTVTSALASLWPALLASRLEPVEAMRS